MSQKKDYDKRLQELQLKMAQLKRQEVQLKKRQAIEEQKKRTKLLIEIGEVVETTFRESLGDSTAKLEKEDLSALIAFLKHHDFSGSILASRADRMRLDTNPDTPDSTV